MKRLARGSKGKWVKIWQTYLRGTGAYEGIVDGDFGPKTHAATCFYQKKNSLKADGIVGNETWGHAMARGLEIIPSPDMTREGPNWPQPTLSPIRLVERRKIFGSFRYQPNPQPGNPEGITILGDWTRHNITTIEIPQLKGVKYAPRSRKVAVNAKIADQLVGLFEAWERRELMDRVLTWGGLWNPRFIRGSRTTLSNHAWGTAFDINVPWNGLGVRPALYGQEGCVRELVETAEEFGFFWGGFWGRGGFSGRPDGMHFECAKIL